MIQAFSRQISLGIGRSGEQTVDLGNLDVSFDVTRSTKRSSNTGTFKLYNVTDEVIATTQKDDGVIYLEAGYSERSLIFVGDIVSCKPKWTGPTLEVSISAKDGWRKYNGGRIRRTLPSGSTTRDAIRVIAQEWGVNKNDFPDVANYVYDNGLMLYGDIRSVLSRVCKAANLQWSIQDGDLFLLHDGDTAADFHFAPVLSDKLIDPPVRSKKDGKFKISAKSLYEPAVRAGCPFVIKHETLEGTFVCNSVRHVGSVFEKDMITTIEGEYRDV